MKRFRFKSLQVRLAMRLAALYVIATVIATGALIYQAYDTASSLNDRELSGRAEDLARAASYDGAGQTRFALPAKTCIRLCGFDGRHLCGSGRRRPAACGISR